MALILNWQKKLGFKSDPFVEEPFYKGQFVGLEPLRRRVNLFLIKSERFGVIKGPEGYGKTTLLKWLVKELRHRRVRVLLINPRGVQSKEKLYIEIFKLLLTPTEKHVSRIDQKRSQEEKERIVKKRLQENTYLILFDNAGSLLPAHQTLIDELLAETKAKILLTDETDKLKKLSFTTKTTLRETIRKYQENVLKKILHDRLKAVGGVGMFPFDDRSLKKVIADADGNPAEMLKLAREKAIELSLKVDKKPKKDTDAWSFTLFGKTIKIPKTPHEKAGKKEHDPKKKPIKHEAKKAHKRFGFLSIEYEDEPDEPTVEIPEPESTHHAPAHQARHAAEHSVKHPDHFPNQHLTKDAKDDAEQLVELLDESHADDPSVEIEVQEEKSKEQPKPSKDEIKITEDLIAEIASTVEKKTKQR